MAKTNKLDQKVLVAFGSVNLNDDDKNRLSITDFANYFGSYIPCSDYYLITHDDTDTFHIHYLIKLNRQVRLGTIINFMADGLSINPLAINIDKCRGLNLCLRYMLHIDDSSKLENKKVFNVSDMVSNRDMNFITTLIECDDDDEISWEKLVKAVVKYNKTSELIKFLGLHAYHKYRFEIKDLLEEKLNSPKFLYEYSYLDDDTPF